MEAGVVVGFDGEPIYWHLPENRTAGSLPDSRKLWEVLWDNRATVYGFAHSHPGSELPVPSWEDITTFSGVELALGRRLAWWIISSNDMAVILWVGPGKYDYERLSGDITPTRTGRRHKWLEELRKHSNY